MSDDHTPWKNEWVEDHEMIRGLQGIITEVRSRDGSERRAVLKQIGLRQRDDLRKSRIMAVSDLGSCGSMEN